MSPDCVRAEAGGRTADPDVGLAPVVAVVVLTTLDACVWGGVAADAAAVPTAAGGRGVEVPLAD